MKNRIENLLADAARKAHRAGALPSGDFPDIEIEEPKGPRKWPPAGSPKFSPPTWTAPRS